MLTCTAKSVLSTADINIDLYPHPLYNSKYKTEIVQALAK